MQHARCKLDPAPQAAGKLLDELFSPISQTQTSQHFVCPRSQLAPAKPIQPAMVHEVFRDGELLVDAWRLEYDAQLTANRISLSSQVGAENSHLALLER